MVKGKMLPGSQHATTPPPPYMTPLSVSSTPEGSYRGHKNKEQKKSSGSHKGGVVLGSDHLPPLLHPPTPATTPTHGPLTTATVPPDGPSIAATTPTDGAPTGG